MSGEQRLALAHVAPIRAARNRRMVQKVPRGGKTRGRRGRCCASGIRILAKTVLCPRPVADRACWTLENSWNRAITSAPGYRAHQHAVQRTLTGLPPVNPSNDRDSPCSTQSCYREFKRLAVLLCLVNHRATSRVESTSAPVSCFAVLWLPATTREALE